MGDKVKGFLFAVLAAILWGVSGSLGQFLFQEKAINVEWLITVRMLITGVLLLFLALIGKNKDVWRIWSNRKHAVQLLFFSIAGTLSVQYTYFAAIKESNAATATVLQYIAPVLIAIYLAIKTKKLPNNYTLISVFLASIGTFLLVTHGDINNLSISKFALILGLISAVSLAFYTLYPIQLLKVYSSSVIIGWSMLIGGFGFSFVKAPWDYEGIFDYQSWLSIGFIILFATLLAFYVFSIAIKLIGGQKTSLITTIEPLSATLLAVFWLNTPYVLVDWIGTCCILMTLVLLGLSKSENT